MVTQKVVRAPEGGEWSLIWADEFDGSGTNLSAGGVDLDKWGFQNGTGAQYGLDGWGNNEQQFYTDDNVTVSDGKLVIEAKPEIRENKTYTSGRLFTGDTFAKKYGKFEARIKMPTGDGFWPAFWMMPKDSKYGGWAASGEIDIMEARGRLPDHIGGTIHYGGSWPDNKFTGKEYHFPDGESIEQFHTYAVEWEPGEIRWYVDGQLYQTLNNWDSTATNQPTKYAYPAPFDEDFYMILNLAVGGNYDGNRLPSPEDFPAKMEVDYVRVYDLTGRPYRTPVEPVIVREELPAGAKEAIDGNYVYDTNFEQPIKTILTDTETLDTTNWNFATINTFGGAGTVSVETIDGDRYAKADITTPGSQTYSIQLIQNVTLGKGRYYKVSFDAKAEANRNINAKLSGGADRGWAAYSDNETIELTTEMAAHAFTFQMQAESDALARLEFNLGTNANDVWIGNVKVEETEADLFTEDAPKEPLDGTGNHVYNGTFDLGRQDRMTYWHVTTANGVAATGSVDPEARELQVAIENGGAAEDVALTQKGINLLPTDVYQLTFKAKADAARNIAVAWLSKDGTIRYSDAATFSLTPTMTEYTTEFTMGEAEDKEAQLTFFLGGSESDVTLDDIVMTRLTNNNAGLTLEEAFPLKNGDFSNGFASWAKHVQGEHDGWGSSASFGVEAGKLKIGVGNIGSNPWDVQLLQTELALIKNRTYVVKFDARSTKPRDMDVVVENAAYQRSLDERVALTADWQRFEYEFAMTKDDKQSFKLLLGSLENAMAVDGAHDVFIDNVVFEVKGERSGVFPLKNGAFADSLIGWSTHVQSGASSASFTGDDNAAKATVEREGTNPWDVMLFQEGMALKKGVTYVVSFVARTDMPRAIQAIVENGSYFRHFDQVARLEKGTNTYAYEFTMERDDVVGLKFLLGKLENEPALGATHDVFIDNVRLEVKGATEALGMKPPTRNDIALPPGPALAPDTDGNALGQPIALTFADDAAWRGAIEAVLVDGAVVPSASYTVGAGAITFEASVFPAAKSYEISVRANGYEYANMTQPIEAEQLWTLVWSDEFDGAGTNLSDGGVNLEKWGFQNGTGAEYGLDGWGNNEQQYYTDDNVNVENGLLVIEAKPEAVGNKKYTSGRLFTADTFTKAYGKFEARIKLPVGEGFWPAFWMMPKDSDYGGWAASGEIDIMEAKGRLPDHIGGTIHYGGSWPNNRYTGKEYNFPDGQSIEQFHTYAVEWEPGEIRWYVDGNLYQTLNNWDSIGNGQPTKFAYPAPFDREFYMILNLAVGGTYDGDREPSASDFPATMEVDYVRVYDLTGRPYREPVEPVILPEPLPEGAKEPIDGNYVHDAAFAQPITVISTDSQSLDPLYWNFAKISTFGGDGSASVETLDGTPFAKLDITNGGSQPHSIQLIQNVSLAKGGHYKVSFDAKAAVDRNMTVKLGGGPERGYAAYSSSETVALTGTVQSYEYKFQMQADSDALARLEFNMGTNVNDVWIGNVRVEETEPDQLNENGAKEPLESGNHVYNGFFNLGHAHRMTYWNFNAGGGAAAAATVDVAAKRLHVDVTSRGGIGDIVLVQKGIQLLQNDAYELTFEAAGAEARSIEVALVSADGSTNYTGHRAIALSTSMGSHKETFTMPAGVTDANAQLVFRFGGDDADVYLNNVSLIRTTDNNVDYSNIDLFPLKNGDFSLGLAAWTPFVQIGQANFAEEGGAAKVTVANVGGEAWNVMLMQEAMKFTKGMEYVIGFDVRSTLNRTVEAVLENAAYARIFETGAIEATTDTKRYEYSFKMGTNETLALKFLLGKTSAVPAGAHEVFIDNVVLELKNPPVKRSPTLAPDATMNRVGQSPELRFTDMPEWRAAIRAVKVNGVATTAYTVEGGKLTLDASNFTQGLAYAIVVEAEGYADASVAQPMYASDGNLVMNGSFAAGTLNWAHLTDVGGVSSFSIADEAAVVEVTNNGGMHPEWNIPVTWSTQLNQGNIDLLAGKTYELSFVARSTAERPIEIEYTGRPGNPKTSFKLTTTNGSYTDRFTVDADTRLTLKYLLGNVIYDGLATPEEAHTVYIDDVVLRQLIVAPTLNADTSYNHLGQPIAITFTDDADWRSAITDIVVSKDGATVTSDVYTSVAAGAITFQAGAFATEGAYTVTVSAAGYPDAVATQTIVGALTTDTIYFQSGGALTMVPGAGAAADTLPQDLSHVRYTIQGVSGVYAGAGDATGTLFLNGRAVGALVRAKISYDFDGNGTWDRTAESGNSPTDGNIGAAAYEPFGVTFNEAVVGAAYQPLQGGNILVEVWMWAAGNDGGGNGEIKVGDPSVDNASRIVLPYTIGFGNGGEPAVQP
ncbi:carbohydrate binding domain-containing protein [Paenibacillus sp. TRM 82003]|nr:carbohydrate binding domain-containing protein [Paenibacillus sp. TRM 82003]